MAKKILVVDDEDLVRRTIAEILSGAGFEVETAAHPGDLLCEDKIYDYDLLIIDFLMPGIPGDTLFNLLAIDAHDGKIPPPVIIVSGYTDDKRVGKWAEYDGVKAVLEKPFDPALLIRTVTENAR